MAVNLKEYLIQFDDIDILWEEYQDYLLALHVSNPNREPLGFDIWKRMEVEVSRVLGEINGLNKDSPQYENKILEWLSIKSIMGW